MAEFKQIASAINAQTPDEPTPMGTVIAGALILAVALKAFPQYSKAAATMATLAGAKGGAQ